MADEQADRNASAAERIDLASRVIPGGFFVVRPDAPARTPFVPDRVCALIVTRCAPEMETVPEVQVAKVLPPHTVQLLDCALAVDAKQTAHSKAGRIASFRMGASFRENVDSNRTNPPMNGARL